MKAPFSARCYLGWMLLFAAICGHAQQRVLRPSELNADSAAFQYKTVTVRGYLTLTPEGHNLYESKALKDEFDKGLDSHAKGFNPNRYDNYCLTIANPGRMYRNRDTLKGKTLVVTGQFLADYNDHKKNRVIDLWACPLPTGIVINMDDLKRRYPKLLPKP
jgi:hypothetical protein